MPKNMNIIKAAADIVGGSNKLALAIGVSPPTVSQWINGSRPIPASRVLAIARATKWQITPHDIRPDIYPSRSDGMPKNKHVEDDISG